eukprot:TRINITY_DN3434_c0_g2_i5.p3 TRINITY_DN3434_c0_g2~~TRINITY_DN3434_c0_g2_i5.p3  ORF type:complete len:102 (-),score=3.27 TRINITY_DN3434_c0_g2_i5:843-1148(-)
MGLGIPDNCTDKPLYIKLIFGIPLLTASVQILLLTYLFTAESPKYLLSVNKLEEVLHSPILSPSTPLNISTPTRIVFNPNSLLSTPLSKCSNRGISLTPSY